MDSNRPVLHRADRGSRMVPLHIPHVVQHWNTPAPLLGPPVARACEMKSAHRGPRDRNTRQMCASGEMENLGAPWAGEDVRTSGTGLAVWAAGLLSAAHI